MIKKGPKGKTNLEEKSEKCMRNKHSLIENKIVLELLRVRNS